jgi:chaperonin cofactor prefoldin
MAEKSSQEIIDGIEKAIEELADMIVKEVSKRPAPKADAKPTENKCCEQKTSLNETIESLNKRIIALEASSEVDLNYLADMKADIKTMQMGRDEDFETIANKFLSFEKKMEDLGKKLTDKLNTLNERIEDLERDVEDLEFSVNDIYTEIILPPTPEKEEDEEDEEKDEEEPEEEDEEDVEKTIIGILNLHNFNSKDFINLLTKLTTDYVEKLKKH